ncbi:HesA/MoeB/ThiF family protein [uncultured Paraglaciecola sp.]|uniref:HesA/MoeB/ThiF family protein n=1 Tax=uncultured Paraglaciecola sp. TaxID=1765024 RepID=UPI0030DA3138|tara:strand:+ start:591 stop:1826 length:1236 start_codon:yes stop_codon:yes gene_type:complete
MSIFNAGEWQQYQRHIQLNDVGVNGQQRLKNARVLLIGAGGLGCPVAMYLGAAGVGHITLVDGDTIAQTNLHRQVLFGHDDIGQSKSRVAAHRLAANNPYITVEAVDANVTQGNVDNLVMDADIVLDCTDNFPARLLINDACITHRTPWIYASVLGLRGQTALFSPNTACFRCVFPVLPQNVPDCNAAGVLCTTAGLMGILQANNCVHYLLGREHPSAGKLQLFDGERNEFRSISLIKNSQCVCSQPVTCPSKRVDFQPSPKPFQYSATGLFHVDVKEKPKQIVAAVSQANVTKAGELNPDKFVCQLGETETALLLDVRSEAEHRGFNIGGHCISLCADFSQLVFAICSDKNRPIFLYCQSGIRSKKACDALRSAGYLNVYCLQDGLGTLLMDYPSDYAHFLESFISDSSV